ncbi:hypothetical protein BSKO_00325 [Bryopsis sp. KO-2023]|nr:hypothetical protein BSKO_00325 [Bryopsis sp. KO-2023]
MWATLQPPIVCATNTSSSRDGRTKVARSTSIFELAQNPPSSRTTDGAAFDRIFDIRAEVATCSAGLALSEKYGVARDNEQLVVSVSNRFSLEQTWFNEERTNKPQSFKRTDGLLDPTNGGLTCDFCNWKEFTAVDDFGRAERPHAVTGSNLFKYCAPSHGIVLFKNHHPLNFTQAEVADLLSVSQEWISKAHGLHGNAHHPLFVWNCLARAGASQFHGHAQVMLSRVPFPADERMKQVTQLYEAAHPGQNYMIDLVRAHQCTGVLLCCGDAFDRCFSYPSLTPWKDMEVVILGSSIESPSFQKLLYTVLRMLVDDFGAASFNVGIQGIQPQNAENGDVSKPVNWWGENISRVLARVVSRGKLTSMASDFGGLEVLGGASIGHTDIYRIARVLSDRCGEDLINFDDSDLASWLSNKEPASKKC